MTVSLFVRIELKPGTRDAFVKRVSEHRRNVIANETYCQRFDVMMPREEDNVVCLYEVYDDEDAFRAHNETTYFAEYRADTGDMVADRARTLSTLVE
jgi:quinol monooxygenase YgiN